MKVVYQHNMGWDKVKRRDIKLAVSSNIECPLKKGAAGGKKMSRGNRVIIGLSKNQEEHGGTMGR
ncbi:MAG: hypothetical protein WC954_04130, partial [Sphaerochaeta sp.]